ncbi:alpha/beta fold hydrolase [Nocardia amikacinitolerans]|uniref:alpha/beta fold hydrolase n=1 Tax=Nocardia amikacinitolerans TaxID=756689 RepID=UPI0020A309EA|nr:alpha/beta fold hydrolase [Nocardia amikacinitolerans]MCP2275803.1 Pimeloyl-ACP methyl ester carboxylesterase [Nocardia amikacinitolerans]MCP2294075.1 Pimeloyl-ACP methyl ester carboxylesterase [Nocardia amikacinitolerans]
MTESSDRIGSGGTHRPRRERTVRGADGELAVFEWGDPRGVPLVLMHGLSDTHLVWREVAVLLADDFRVVAYDARGHGESETPSGPGAFRLDRLANDLYAVLDAVSPNQPAHVCGHGWGAIQGWEAVCDPRANTRIASFTAISGPNLDHLGVQLRELAVRPHRIQRLLADRKFWRHGAGSARTAAVRVTYPPRMRTWLIELLGGIPAAYAPIAPTWRSDLIAGARIAHANLAPRLLRPRPRPTPVPVQMVVDTTDVLVPPFLYYGSARWVDRLWRCSIPADHWLPSTEPLLVAEALGNFVEDLTAADTSLPRG